jgi:hypothetical protein
MTGRAIRHPQQRASIRRSPSCPGHARMAVIDLTELTPFGSGKSAILRDFGVLRRKFPEPMAVSSEVGDGRAWFGGRIPLPLNPNLGTISTIPPQGYKPSLASNCDRNSFRSSKGKAGLSGCRDPGPWSRLRTPLLVNVSSVPFGVAADRCCCRRESLAGAEWPTHTGAQGGAPASAPSVEPISSSR